VEQGDDGVTMWRGAGESVAHTVHTAMPVVSRVPSAVVAPPCGAGLYLSATAEDVVHQNCVMAANEEPEADEDDDDDSDHEWHDAGRLSLSAPWRRHKRSSTSRAQRRGGKAPVPSSSSSSKNKVGEEDDDDSCSKKQKPRREGEFGVDASDDDDDDDVEDNDEEVEAAEEQEGHPVKGASLPGAPSMLFYTAAGLDEEDQGELVAHLGAVKALHVRAGFGDAIRREERALRRAPKADVGDACVVM
jgi:hypothetical protein